MQDNLYWNRIQNRHSVIALIEKYKEIKAVRDRPHPGGDVAVVFRRASSCSDENRYSNSSSFEQ